MSRSPTTCASIWSAGWRRFPARSLEFARLEFEIFREPNPRVADSDVAEATLYLKGITLRARDSSPQMLHSLNLVVDELARQVKRHRDKRRHRREAHVGRATAVSHHCSPAAEA